MSRWSRRISIRISVYKLNGDAESYLLSDRIRRLHSNSALSLRGSSVSGEADVPLISPLGSPRVLHDPVVLSVLSSVSNSQDSVVQLGSTVSVKDSRRVELESTLVSLNGNGDGLKSNSSLESSFVVGSNIDKLGDSGDRRAGLAGSVFSLVRIRRLVADSLIVDDVLESIVHQSSVASLVALCLRAINELLLRERHELSSLDGNGTLDRAGGGEGPAGSALALILDISHSILGSPIDRVRNIGSVSEVDRLGEEVSASGDEAKALTTELLESQVSKLVHG